MNLDGIIRRSYTLEDFKRELPERRLEILTTIVASPIPTALLYQSLVPGIVYTSGRQLLESLLEYLGIPYEEFKENKNLYKGCIPVDLPIYRKYISILNVMINTNLVTKVGPKIHGFTLTDFGRITQEFLGYTLKKLVENEMNPIELFGYSPKNVVKTLDYIYKKGETSVSDILKSLNIPLSTIYRLKTLGLIEYEPGRYRTRSKRYIINRDKLTDMLKCLEDKECKRNAEHKYHIPTNIARMVIEYLMESNLTNITIKELTKALKANYGSMCTIVRWLTHEGVLSAEILPSIRITKKGRIVYEEIIRPILEVAEDPDKITKYRAKLSDKDKWKLLDIHCTYRYFHGKREGLILSALQEWGDLTIEEIANITGLNIDTIYNILRKLKKEGIVKKDENNRWYISDPRYKSI